MKTAIAIMCAALAVPAANAAAQGGTAAYHLVAQIPVGGPGGWDYLSIDPGAHRLYVSHSTKVVVIDTASNTVVGEIADTNGVHGFAIASDLGRGFSSNGRANTLSVVDLKTLQTTATIAVGQNPDAILYDPARHEVYAMNGRSGSVSVVDARAGTVVATIPVNGKPESAAADPDAHRLFVNIEDKNAIAVIDTASRKLIETWPLAPGEEPTGMAIDRAAHRLFVGCGNKMMLMIDATNGKVVATVPTGDGVDSTWFEPDTKLAFSSAREGIVTVAREASPSTMSVVENFKTAPGARTMALDPETHRVYLSVADYVAAPAAPPAGQRVRPQTKPDTFRVLVFAKK